LRVWLKKKKKKNKQGSKNVEQAQKEESYLQSSSSLPLNRPGFAQVTPTEDLRRET
jgi:hypothetical protein